MSRFQLGEQRMSVTDTRAYDQHQISQAIHLFIQNANLPDYMAGMTRNFLTLGTMEKQVLRDFHQQFII